MTVYPTWPPPLTLMSNMQSSLLILTTEVLIISLSIYLAHLLAIIECSDWYLVHNDVWDKQCPDPFSQPHCFLCCCFATRLGVHSPGSPPIINLLFFFTSEIILCKLKTFLFPHPNWNMETTYMAFSICHVCLIHTFIHICRCVIYINQIYFQIQKKMSMFI